MAINPFSVQPYNRTHAMDVDDSELILSYLQYLPQDPHLCILDYLLYSKKKQIENGLTINNNYYHNKNHNIIKSVSYDILIKEDDIYSIKKTNIYSKLLSINSCFIKLPYKDEIIKNIKLFNTQERLQIIDRFFQEGVNFAFTTPELSIPDNATLEAKVELIRTWKKCNDPKDLINYWDKFKFSHEEIMRLPQALLQSATQTSNVENLANAVKMRHKVFKDTKKSELLSKILVAVHLSQEEALFARLSTILSGKEGQKYTHDNSTIYPLLQTIFNIIMLLPSEVTNSWLEGNENPDDVFQREFQQLFPAASSPQWVDRYMQTLGSFRNPSTIISYINSFQKLDETTKTLALGSLYQFVQHVMHGTFSEARYDPRDSVHLQTLFSIPGLKDLWTDMGSPQKVDGSDGKRYIVTISDDPCDLLHLGDEVQNSCMRSLSLAKKNPAVFGYIFNGETLPIILKEEGKEKIFARAVMRLLWNPLQQIPVLLLEKEYTNKKDDPLLTFAIVKMAKDKAQQMNVPLISIHFNAYRTVFESMDAEFLGGHAPFIYTDSTTEEKYRNGKKPCSFQNCSVLYNP